MTEVCEKFVSDKYRAWCIHCGDLIPQRNVKRKRLKKRPTCQKCRVKSFKLPEVCLWEKYKNVNCNCVRCTNARRNGGLGLWSPYTDNEVRILIALLSARRVGVVGVGYQEISDLTGLWLSMIVRFCKDVAAVHQWREKRSGRRVLNAIDDTVGDELEQFIYPKIDPLGAGALCDRCDRRAKMNVNGKLRCGVCVSDLVGKAAHVNLQSWEHPIVKL